jgi:hypothetical protein
MMRCTMALRLGLRFPLTYRLLFQVIQAMLSRVQIRALSGNETTARWPEHNNDISSLRRDQMLRRVTLAHVDALFMIGALAVSAIAYAVLFTNINSVLN